ncbi:MAG: class A beta-lactamase-related serine hydrolase [Pedobacter sp.]|nr:MAG: class A beta-lactamase-related serine hydrolase [Pedobacter sp.]
MKKLFAVFIFSFIFCSSKAQKLKDFADSIRVANEIPELTYAVFTSDSIISTSTLGYHRADLKTEESKAKTTDFLHLGSNTKAITGFIAGYLTENKKISWTTKFYELFPEWKTSANPVYLNITLADLLSHRARIKPFNSGAEFQTLPKFTGNKSEQRKEFAKYLLSHDPVGDNDEPYNYSNAGYSIAALMLEKASGKTWEVLIDEVLGKKLKLSYKIGWPNRNDENQPWGHLLEHNLLTPLPASTSYNLNLIEPAGDISMPLDDYVKFIQLNLSGLKGKDNFLKATTYNYLHYGIDKYSIGWLNVNASGKHLTEHAGSAGTFYAYTLINKDKNIAYIIIANSATEKSLKGIFTLLEKLIKSTES